LFAKEKVIAYARFTNREMLITICSMEETEKRVLLPISDYGFDPTQVEELLGREFSRVKTSEGMEVVVPAKGSFLLSIK